MIYLYHTFIINNLAINLFFYLFILKYQFIIINFLNLSIYYYHFFEFINLLFFNVFIFCQLAEMGQH